MQPEEAVISSKQILNHPNMIKQPYFAWSDHQQVIFQETVVLHMHINTCELSHHGQKSAIDHLKSSITHNYKHY